MKSKVLAEAVVKVLNEMQQDGSYKKLMDEFGLLPNSKPFIINAPGT
jgi:polar amino acid transport system substrate-binding protein